MQAVAERTSVERGAREASCEIGGILGRPLSAFADVHEGVKDIALSGTCEQVIIEPFTIAP